MKHKENLPAVNQFLSAFNMHISSFNHFSGVMSKHSLCLQVIGTDVCQCSSIQYNIPKWA